MNKNWCCYKCDWKH